MRFTCLAPLLLLAACGRPLTEGERRFITDIHGETIDFDRVRLHRAAALSLIKLSFPARPRVACQERMFPPPSAKILTGSPGAAVAFNRILVNKNLYAADYTPSYPRKISLVHAMLLAHEMTHVWQWQNREITGYHPTRALREHRYSEDPYLFDLSTKSDFLSYGYEQQGAIVEEFLCCQVLAPKAARTDRLRQLLSPYFPVARLENLAQSTVALPWNGIEIDTICD